MTGDETAFWQHLEEHPDDTLTRLVFADWLQDRGDERAEGMRALVAGEHLPDCHAGEWFYGRWSNTNRELWKTSFRSVYKCLLPDDWWEWSQATLSTMRYWKFWQTRQEAENAACVAFARLPASRRAELLESVGASC